MRRLLFALLLLTTACGEADFEAVDLNDTRSLMPAECTVRGESAYMEGLFVTADDGTEFFVDADDVAVTARVPQAGEPTSPVSVEISGALRFEAFSAAPNFVLSSYVETSAGIAKINPGTQLYGATSTNVGVVGTAMGVGPISIPCAAITLDDVNLEWEAEASQLKNIEGDGTTWRVIVDEADDEEGEYIEEDWEFDIEDVRTWEPPTPSELFEERLEASNIVASAATIEMFERPGSGQRVTLDAEFKKLHGLESHRDWIKVAALLPYGQVTGWVERDALEPEDGSWSYGSGFGCGGIRCCGAMAWGTFGPNYRGPAQLRVGAKVHTTSELDGAWATVARADEFRVHVIDGEPWAQITGAPDLGDECARMPEAYVARDAVILPKD